MAETHTQVPLGDIEARADSQLTHEELIRLGRVRALAEAVVDFCQRVGLPVEVGDHITAQLRLANEEDFPSAAAYLEALSDLFEEDAAGDQILQFPEQPAANQVTATDPVDVVPVIAAQEPPQVASPEIESTIDSEAVETTVGAESQTLDIHNDKVERFLDKLYGVEQPLPRDLTIDKVIEDIVQLLGTLPRRKVGDPRDMIAAFLAGTTYATIAEGLGSTEGAIAQWFSSLTSSIRNAKGKSTSLPGQNTTEDQREQPARVATEERPAQAVVVPTPLRPRPPVATVSNEVHDEPPHVVIAYKLVQITNLPSELRQALEEHVNPRGSVNGSSNKERAIGAVRGAVTREFGALRLPEGFEFEENERRLVASVLGIHFLPDDNQWKSVPPQTVAARIGKLTARNKGRITSKELEAIINNGLRKIVAALEKQTELRDAQRIELQHAVIDDMLEACEGLGFDKEEADAIVQRFVPIHGNLDYKIATDTTRIALYQLRKKVEVATGLASAAKSTLMYLTTSIGEGDLPSDVMALKIKLEKEHKLDDNTTIEAIVLEALQALDDYQNRKSA